MELIEYVIAFGISAGVAGASIMLVDGALPGLNQVAAQSASDQIASAARISVIEDRNVTLLVPLHGSSIVCNRGELSITMSNSSRSYEAGYPCAFDFEHLDGSCSLDFSAPADSLLLEVQC
ncbi:MAG: hypothetical protein OK455_03905 [Thaumarchaeota archaeon]|nr:hypothetical protein [Nitrososphaerota archaeon]